jgi:hypothetical protein
LAVYVDDMEASFGVARRWHQKAGTPRSHYDICLSKKALALAAGAVAITLKQAGAMAARRRETGELGKPEEAIAWLHGFNAQKRAKAEA